MVILAGFRIRLAALQHRISALNCLRIIPLPPFSIWIKPHEILKKTTKHFDESVDTSTNLWIPHFFHFKYVGNSLSPYLIQKKTHNHGEKKTGMFLTWHLLTFIDIYEVIISFLDATSHLYKRLCLSVRRSVRPSVGPSVGNQFAKM